MFTARYGLDLEMQFTLIVVFKDISVHEILKQSIM